MSSIRTLAVEWAEVEVMLLNSGMPRKGIPMFHRMFYAGARSSFELLTSEDADQGTLDDVLAELVRFGEVQMATASALKERIQRKAGEIQQ